MYQKEKKKIINVCNQMIKKNITRETGGNVSIFLPKEKLMLITPSGIPYDQMTEADIVEMTLDGNIIKIKKNLKPSSEWLMHAKAYQVKPNCFGMVHAHAINAMIVSTLFKSLPAIDYLIAFSGNYEVPVSKYMRFGSKELANESAKYLAKYYAVILANHGINVCAENLDRALAILENLELCAELYCRAKILGNPKILAKKEMLELVKIFKKTGYGRVSNV